MRRHFGSSDLRHKSKMAASVADVRFNLSAHFDAFFLIYFNESTVYTQFS